MAAANTDIVVSNRGSTTVSVLLGNGNGTYQGEVLFTTGSHPYGVVAADVNGDGKIDIVTANHGAFTISCLLGNGNGTFQAKADFTAATGANPKGLALGDLNGDGKLDVVTTAQGKNNVGVLLGNGNGTFGAPTTFATGSGTYSSWEVAIGDVNGDGKPDIVATNYGGSTVSVLLSNGDGTFQTHQDFTTGSHPYVPTIADVNGDGIADLVIPNRGATTVSVLLGNNNGTFGAKTDFTVGTTPYAAVVTDLNGDGKVDLLVVNKGSNNVSVLLGNGNGTFQAKTDFATGSSSTPFGMAVGDVNADGKVDIVAAGGFVSVLLGNGNGTFAPETSFTTAGLLARAALGQTTATITKYAVTAAAGPAPDVGFAMTVKSEDASSNVISFYQGIAHFTGGGAGATLPANYTFTPTDAGTHVFSCTLHTSGSQTVTVTDTVTGTITGTLTLTVSGSSFIAPWWQYQRSMMGALTGN